MLSDKDTSSQWRVEQASREVIERKLLTALEDESQVAILATRGDIGLLINALEQYNTVHAKQWAADLKRLRLEAFGGFPSRPFSPWP